MDRHTAPRGQLSGTLISTPIDHDGAVQRDTVSCCHCGFTWVWMPGSGRRRGFCMRCNGITCGAERCDKNCLPQEAQLEAMERGIPWELIPFVGIPTVVRVPAPGEGLILPEARPGG